ncbi:MAG: YdjY domain-containing protein [Planctomycetota bacterium]
MIGLVGLAGLGFDGALAAEALAADAQGDADGALVVRGLPAPVGATRLDPERPVWIDDDATRVFADGEVVLREGVLEMFACPAGSKEHESVVAIDSPALLLHVALLRIGAEPGKPVQFEPQYRAPSGDEIEVAVEWRDESGARRTARAQDWVYDTRRERAMDLPFVFGGSGFWTDPETGEQHYLAEAGDLICVSNFGAAMLDVPAPSTQANDGLWYAPYTERIPPVGTPMRVVLSVAADDADADIEGEAE